MNKRNIKILLFLLILSFPLILLLLFIYSDKYINQIETSNIEDLKTSQSQFIETSHGNIHYLYYPNTDTLKISEPVIFLHGFGGNSQNWRKNLTECAKLTDCYAIDLKGFGLTKELKNRDMTHDSQADMVIEVLDKLQLQNVNLVGNSMGGAIAMAIALKAEERIVSLTLISTSTPQEVFSRIPLINLEYISRLIYPFIVRKESFNSLLELAYGDKTKITQKDIDSYYLPFTIKGSFNTLQYLMEYNIFPTVISSISNFPNLLFKKNEREIYDISKLTIPTLIIHGEKDRVIDFNNSVKLSEKIKGSKLILFRDTGHLSMEEEPDKFNTLLTEFLLNPNNVRDIQESKFR